MKDRDLMKIVEEREHLREQLAKAEAKEKKMTARIVAEMERREIRALEAGTFRVSYVAPQVVEINFDKLRTKLTPPLLKKVTKLVLDKDALADQVQAGKIPQSLVSRYSSVVPRAPYIRVSIKKDEAA